MAIFDYLRHFYATIYATYTNDGKLKFCGGGILWGWYLLNFGCGVVLSHFHATFTPFYANQGISGVRSPSNFEKHVKTHHHAKFHAFFTI